MNLSPVDNQCLPVDPGCLVADKEEGGIGYIPQAALADRGGWNRCRPDGSWAGSGRSLAFPRIRERSH